MRDLIVPDIHMKLNMMDYVIKTAKEHNVDHITFLGDYFDEWNQKMNAQLYRDTIKQLERINQDFNCTFLIGNHDVPYLINRTYHFSTPFDDVRLEIRDCLRKLKVQLVHNVQGYYCSHAGITEGFEPEPWAYQEVSNRIGNLVDLDSNDYSPIWMRPQNIYVPDAYEKQIVGHSPVETVIYNSEIIFTDTWSVTPQGNPIGDKSLIIIENKEVKIIPFERTN